jgi:hypothetical protein
VFRCGRHQEENSVDLKEINDVDDLSLDARRVILAIFQWEIDGGRQLSPELAGMILAELKMCSSTAELAGPTWGEIAQPLMTVPC